MFDWYQCGGFLLSRCSWFCGNRILAQNACLLHTGAPPDLSMAGTPRFAWAKPSASLICQINLLSLTHIRIACFCNLLDHLMISIENWHLSCCTLCNQSGLSPSQWETSLQSNAVSHWLGANLESSLMITGVTAGCLYATSGAVFLSWNSISEWRCDIAFIEPIHCDKFNSSYLLWCRHWWQILCHDDSVFIAPKWQHISPACINSLI